LVSTKSNKNRNSFVRAISVAPTAHFSGQLNNKTNVLKIFFTERMDFYLLLLLFFFYQERCWYNRSHLNFQFWKITSLYDAAQSRENARERTLFLVRVTETNDDGFSAKEHETI
jgi:hypothetical protein